MAARQELAQLVTELKSTRSPVGRMKLLARGWRVIRDLNPGQRRELARQFGIDGAEEWLDRSAGARRLDWPWLAKLLRKAKTLELEELRSQARSLQDPGARGELLRRSVDAVAEEFVGTDAATTLEVVEAAVAEGAQGTPVKLPVSPPPEAIVTESGSLAPAAAPEAVEREAAIGPTGDLAAEATEPPTPKIIGQVPAAPASAAVSPTMAGWPSAVETRPAPTPTSREPARAESAIEIVEQVRSATRLTLQFRLLRRHLDDLRGASPDQLRSLIESFPGGWARRRALASLLRQRIPDSLHRAVFLIESLETAASRRWCVATLLAYWDLSPVERETLIERHDLPRFRARRRAGASVADRAAPPA